NSTVGNNGTKHIKQTERWWLNQSSAGHSGGILIGQVDDTNFAANSVNTRSITLTMPPIPVGTYFLFHGVDVFSEVDESRENDNAVRESLVVQVILCQTYEQADQDYGVLHGFEGPTYDKASEDYGVLHDTRKKN
ncbi:MAG: hypothetical protein OEQ18_03550, partial [Gammaproteobacteria bacterium]|nr:hypothetical protein [Gammaproteobacteria bacterium]